MKKIIESVSFDDKNYPALLKEIPDPPTRLFCRGQLPHPDSICIAIIGTRKATAQGKIMAQRIARDLAANGIVIVSGLAIGIDTVAHKGALEASGKTIAVLANGLDNVYPAQNTSLASDLLAHGGAILSEYPTGTPAYPNQFLERNRIVSGLCVATIVVEAPERSGTLATARFALEQGREVFVVPGPADHPNYIGSHRLIRDGARLVTAASDIYEDLGINPKSQSSPQQSLFAQEATPMERAIMKVLTEAGKPMSIDKIAERTTMEARAINTALTSLVMAELVKETEHGYSI
ncbi:DNA protecting protein DprA [Candidatus Wolfebacteria bacterium RIFOXYD12_FULL_48_21]|uniref:DNA protecting protein DprA n=1 Tax=Candidatus Wolfebacteria bacterium RIFOXYD1_FULL_48_65 TaxID=1802561 RepID=A0A1F8E061_9BACT|nr:MAG: DNA protecting protein DprA [Candidatus Wolfebacteria bacterium RIFOXYD1_FULL_48_65]OGM95167.1 MAG: DNA protecting protein DprA [Candidatus Wolfebacteria bacterium RIFOXYD12_FULL_48_21]OGM95743.1 MAG: DNA protecting protein DprA [Candidatus Wolfebacteria bacterium RIFOXYD2_FULL_48_11]